MKYQIIIFSILIGLNLTGCAPKIYQKPGASTSDFEKDKHSCEFYLKTHGDGIAWPDLMNSCLIEKGWSLQNH